MLYAVVLMVAMVAFVSLAVDLGRSQVAKTELRRGADSAARYGAEGLKNVLSGSSAASSNAIAAASDNTVDGTPLTLQSGDIQLVVWDTANKTYTVTTDPTVANAVRVTAQRTSARGNPIKMNFAGLIGFNNCDITATSTALYTSGASHQYTVNATGNPFLAGMPAGSVASLNNPHNDPDYAGTASNPLQSPLQATLPFTPGVGMTFDGVNGNAGNSSSSGNFSADGNPGDLEQNSSGNDNNILGMTGPLNCLVGVFLDSTAPNTTPVPTPDANACTTDFSTQAARDQLTYAPKLKQIFFIGDGRTSDGEVQHFVPPGGATRLFLATWDGYEWSNNVGSFSVTDHPTPGTVTLVQ